MKEICEKYKLIITLILKNITYFGWYAYAFIAPIFIKDTISDINLFYLIITFLIIYLIREIAKHYYKKLAHDSYYEFKHNIEMNYYKKMNNLKMESIENIDKEYLADKMLEVSYNSTRIVCTTGEYIIPAIIGVLLILIKMFTINYIIGSIILILFAIILLTRHHYLTKQEIPKHSNYNDLLKDYVLNIKSIKKLNIFDFTYKKLDEHRENDLLVVKGTDEASDIRFNNGVFIILTVILLSLFFIIEGTTNTLGLMTYFILIIIKLQDLLYQISPTIINIEETKKNQQLLMSYFKDLEELKYENNYKRVSVIDGVVKYKSGVSIKIPDFTLTKGDQISILGKSGQGKSTILNVLSGSSKLNEGKILFDNKEKNSVVNGIHVTKETAIFKLSLRDNICLGENISDNELIKLINEIGLNNWFNSLIYGLDTILDEKEIKLSNSQKQKINILRTMVTKKELIFLDEPSHDLDIETEKKVAEMIKKNLKKKTIIVVTHRPTLTTVCKKHFFIKDHTLLESEPLL